MRILVEGESRVRYLAKCHEAFRTGLRGMFDARCFGKGYPGYWPFIQNYSKLIQHVFPAYLPDIVLAELWFPDKPAAFKYRGLADVKPLKAFIFGDYWITAERHHEEFVRLVQDNQIDLIICYFPQPLRIWAGTPIADKFIHLPPSFDPRIFNDWQMEKTHDVGFLAAGTTEPSPFYPERNRIHQKLLNHPRVKYLWAAHPGWRSFRADHPLVGQGFSKAINSCRIFITTGGRFRNAHAKYVEILASKSLLMADEPIGWEGLRLADGVNYVQVSEDNVVEKIDYYLARPELAQQIAESGHALALRYHNCYARAMDFHGIVAPIIESRRQRRP